MGIEVEITQESLNMAVEIMQKRIMEEMLIDLENEIRDNAVRMELSGATHELLTNIYTDFDRGAVIIGSGHAVYVEFGTVGMIRVPDDPYAGTSLAGEDKTAGRRGAPPLERIEDWVRIKGLVRTKSGAKSRSKKRIHEVARAVQRTIYIYGTVAKPFVRNAIDTIRNRWDNAEVVLVIK